MNIRSLFLVGLCYLGAQSGRAEEPAEKSTVTACTGSNLTLPWRFDASAGETSPQTMNWVFAGTKPSTYVAVNGGENLVVSPAYSHRAQVTHEGVLLRELSPGDSGIYRLTGPFAYSPEGLASETVHELRLSVGGLDSDDGDLHVELGSKALWESESNQWMIKLSCGNFSFPDQPSIDIMWTTPTGQSRPSSAYSHGQFHLHLSPPFRGGRYNCHVPPVHFAEVCVPPGGGSQGDGKLEASVWVDEAVAGLMVSEADRQTLAEEMRDLRNNQTQLREEMLAREEETRKTMDKWEEVIRKMREESERQREEMRNLTEESERQREEMRSLREEREKQEEDTRTLREASEKLKEKTGSLTGETTRLTQEIARLRDAAQVSQNLNGTLSHLKERINLLSTNVAFMTQMSRSVTLTSYRRVKLDRVHYNAGNAYQTNTAAFTAPLSGTYLFFLKTEAKISHAVSLIMNVEGKRVLYLYAHDEKAYHTPAGTVVVHLNRGHRVWVDTGWKNPNLVSLHTVFGGVLVRPDVNA